MRVAAQLLSYAPEHTAYREVFAGGAALFFHKPKVAHSWINDTHPGLYALYATLRDNFNCFAHLCRMQGNNLKQVFNYWVSRRDLMDAPGDEMLVERAVQFFFINRTVWTGRVVYDPTRKSRLFFSNPEGWKNLDKKLERLKAISEKLQDVKITCRSFEKCLTRATPSTLIYCDPPYIRDTYCHCQRRSDSRLNQPI